MKQGKFDKLLVQSANERAIRKVKLEKARRIYAKLELKCFQSRWSGWDFNRAHFLLNKIEQLERN